MLSAWIYLYFIQCNKPIWEPLRVVISVVMLQNAFHIKRTSTILTKSRTEKRSKFMISEAFGAIGDAFGRKSHAPKRPKMRRLCAIRALRFFATTKKPEVFDCCLGPEKWSSSSNGALTRLQRAPRQVATERSLHCREGPVAEPGGRRGASPRPSPRGGRTNVIHKQLRIKALQKQ